ncbi:MULTISPECIES: hypothetical protein [Dickeya]|uniref:Uncharacterized protein n=1 Tax=Dickeya aquatica TaxID=1401087 RepID=A0A375A8M5_9GAMM|nr:MULTISPECIES: hypothetical protein [Dickeya]SLM62380.1 hypothetical protein DAQ1742_01393 [Dickeya aquatica]
MPHNRTTGRYFPFLRLWAFTFRQADACGVWTGKHPLQDGHNPAPVAQWALPFIGNTCTGQSGSTPAFRLSL